MYEIAAAVDQCIRDGIDPTLATVVALRGFSTGEPAASWGRLPDGSVLGDPPAALADRSVAGDGLVEVAVSDAEATSAGLACGGIATLLVRPASTYPAQLWSLLIEREPVCLVVHGSTADVFTTSTIRSAQAPGDQIARLFGRGTSVAAMVEDAVAVAFWPVPTLVVVGDGLIAQALRDAATLLGWQCRITPQVDDAVAAITDLHRSDAVVVLSHDRDVDGPVLAAALASGAGYVGGLGSRHTQNARRTWLTAHAVPIPEQARIHGPAGLDIDAHTPAEMAVSIVAEILAARAGSSGGPLRERGGPVHVAGVQAPPPRY